MCGLRHEAGEQLEICFTFIGTVIGMIDYFCFYYLNLGMLSLCCLSTLKKMEESYPIESLAF